MPDLKLIDAEPAEDEREAIDAVVGVEATNGNRVFRRDRTRRHLLLPALRAAQRRVGWVTPGALGYASRRLDVPPAEAYGVATFYAMLALEERPVEVLHVCDDLSCRLAGAEIPEEPSRRRVWAYASARPPLCERLRDPSRVKSSSRRPPRRCRRPAD